MSKIEWCDVVWNPTVGCSRVSSGCEHCFAQSFAHRGLSERHRGLTVMGSKGPRWTGEVRLVPEALGTPLRWRKPRRVFVNSMSDLFHESLPFETIAAVFGVMAASTQHTFQVLTKRPARMLEFFEWLGGAVRFLAFPPPPIDKLACLADDALTPHMSHADLSRAFAPGRGAKTWPLPNVWLGVSVEDQATADERIPPLLECPAAVRWVSYEPALGPVDFMKWLDPYTCSNCGFHGSINDCDETCCSDCDEAAVYDDAIGSAKCPKCGKDDGTSDSVGFTCPGCGSVESWGRDYGHKFEGEAPLLDWIVVGGESGPGARPFDVAWARSVIAQGRDAGVPVFVKQLGSWAYAKTWDEAGRYPRRTQVLGAARNDLSATDLTAPNVVVRLLLEDTKGGDMAEWPEDLRVRQWPGGAHG